MYKGYKQDRVIRNVNEKVEKESFISKHIRSLKDFTRNRTLTFTIVFMLIFKKSIKSLQLALNELFINKIISTTVSSSAYTQARKKLRHTAFIELNDDTINIYYSDDDIKTWQGYRCLAVDGSKIILPNTKEVKNEFGEIKITNQYMKGTYTGALFECCYDALNHIVVQSILTTASSYEVDLASEMLHTGNFSKRDLLIYDRGYASYEFLAALTQKSVAYVVRWPRNSFKAAQSLFDQAGHWSKVVTLTAPRDQKKNILAKELPLEIKVRFVSVILSTGEVEVLATSLMESTIKRDEFKKLYHLRWSVEDFFSLVKGRLCLENFTGKSVESIKQDFWSTIFITNIESILTEEIEEEINSHVNDDQLNKKINHAVSFNAIKNMAFEIFFNEKNTIESIKKLKLIFKTNTIVQRIERNPSRKKTSYRRSYNFLRRIKKYVF